MDETINKFILNEDDIIPYARRFLLSYLEKIIQDPENTILNDFWKTLDDKIENPMERLWYGELSYRLDCLERRMTALEMDVKDKQNQIDAWIIQLNNTLEEIKTLIQK